MSVLLLGAKHRHLNPEVYDKMKELHTSRISVARPIDTRLDQPLDNPISRLLRRRKNISNLLRTPMFPYPSRQRTLEKTCILNPTYQNSEILDPKHQECIPPLYANYSAQARSSQGGPRSDARAISWSIDAVAHLSSREGRI